ncbi:hypothetical protein ACFXKG_16745 [Streptomyces sp. NPDC059255]|uniref:hypothetical protein n=1 Tax=Streptomyces sp. NPDC059255 TaxID=3346793 RepID=UPI00367CBC1D
MAPNTPGLAALPLKAGPNQRFKDELDRIIEEQLFPDEPSDGPVPPGGPEAARQTRTPR